MDGFSVCMFAYGQTGSGKTFTMEGTAECRGVNPRSMQLLFERITQSQKEFSYTVSMSMLEIYNESIRDLLALPADRGKSLEVRQGPQGNHVPDCRLEIVTSVEAVNELWLEGSRNRSVASTNMNEHSSRSHCVLSVTCACAHRVTGARTVGRLHLIDLAGSERVGKSGAAGERLKEAQALNTSLSALGDVIQARAERQKHVPFRNGVLTHLLADSLSGDSKTLMVVNASPVLATSEETFCSLNFASRVRSVELGQAKRHVAAPAAAAAVGSPGK